MTDQEVEGIDNEVDVNVEEVNEQQSEVEGKEEQPEQEEFLILRGHYKYGGRNKTYGIFELIGERGTAKFNYVNLGSSTNYEVYQLFLDVNDQQFREKLEQLVAIDNTQDRTISREIKKELVLPEIIELLTTNNQDQVIQLIKEIIEDEMQEEIDLEINWEFISWSDLAAIYPERFNNDQDESEVKESSEELENLEGLDNEGLSGGLDIDLKLNCSPVISAISGKLITSFNIGDEILVRITDNRDITGELKNKIKISNGLGVGTITEINYKEEVDRYNVLVQLGEKIYGQLVVGPKVMISSPESTSSNNADNDIDRSSAQNNNDSAIIFTVAGLLIIIIILLLLYL